MGVMADLERCNGWSQEMFQEQDEWSAELKKTPQTQVF